MSNHEASDPRLIWHCVKCTKYVTFLLKNINIYIFYKGRVFLEVNQLPVVAAVAALLKKRGSQIKIKVQRALFLLVVQAKGAALAVDINPHLLRLRIPIIYLKEYMII